jgi:hypothetical protein
LKKRFPLAQVYFFVGHRLCLYNKITFNFYFLLFLQIIKYLYPHQRYFFLHHFFTLKSNHFLFKIHIFDKWITCCLSSLKVKRTLFLSLKDFHCFWTFTFLLLNQILNLHLVYIKRKLFYCFNEVIMKEFIFHRIIIPVELLFSWLIEKYYFEIYAFR